MFSNLLTNIDGIYIYPIISMFIFIPLFVGIVIWAFRADKNYISKMENLPLENISENNIFEYDHENKK